MKKYIALSIILVTFVFQLAFASGESKISPDEFYHTWQGHKVSYLEKLLSTIKNIDKDKHIVFLAGDSSLDNKAWVSPDSLKPLRPLNGYELFLKDVTTDPDYNCKDPHVEGCWTKPDDNGVSHADFGMRPDVSYHLNKDLLGTNYVALNSAVEATTLGERTHKLLSQDQFIRDHITNDDILIVSVGGNDVALHPTVRTIFNMAKLIYMNSLDTLKNHPFSAWGFNHLKQLFGDKVKAYVLKLIGNKRPKKIIICTIYFPDEKPSQGWADTALYHLGYDSNPAKLQAIITQIFQQATSKIEIPGSKVIPVPLFKVLDGKNSKDYVQRVEPSDQGGAKMAAEFARIILQ